MAKSKDKTISVLISVAVLVILAIAFLSSIATQTLSTTQKTVVSDEQHLLSATGACTDGTINETYTYTLTNAPTGWKLTDSDCVVGNFVISNSSGTAFTETTDYVVNTTAGTYTLKNTAAVNQSCATGDNITLVDYDYCGDSYMADSWGRSILNTNTGLFAIAILIAVIAVVYLLMKKSEE
jgi:hypothetical protein